MSKRLQWLAVLAVLMLGTVFAMPQGASAAQGAPAAANQVQQRVDAIVRLNKGARQISANSVQIEDGVIMSVLPPNGTVGTLAAGNCPYKYLCLYQNSNFGGYTIQFYTCAFRNLGDYTMPNGQRWNDQVSSIVNNQTSGTQSYFYNWNGSNAWIYLKTLTAYGYLQNLAYDLGADGYYMNDRIDAVSVC